MDLLTFDVITVEADCAKTERDRAVVSQLQHAGYNCEGPVKYPQVSSNWWGTGASHILLQLQSTGASQRRALAGSAA